MKQKKLSASAFDLAVGALTVLLVIAAVVFSLHTRAPERTAAPLSYTVRILGVSTAMYDVASVIVPEDGVFSGNGTLPLGTVRQVSILQHRKAVAENGAVVLADVPELVDIDVTVDAVGTYAAGLGWRVSDVRLAAGDVGDFHVGGYYAANALLLSVAVGTEGVE